MLVTYLMVYFLIPRYLIEKKYKQFALYSFYLFVIASYLITVILFGCLIFLLDFRMDLMPPMTKNFFFILILVYLVAGVVSSIKILQSNFEIQTKNRELHNKILETQLELKDQELHFLKRQIHPHFLFNTLNTIYGLALQESKQTPDIILKLSNLLDYILYQVSKPRVSLHEEILHIREYMELERFRFKDTLKVSFESDKIDDSIEIAPMMLIPFVENAFKHGSLENGFLNVDVEVRIVEKQLRFKIKNTYIDSEPEKKDKGIGLTNIKKRLELNYPNNYKLDIGVSGNYFFVELMIVDLTQIKNVSAG
jgi:two-component system LytT family sensor kinase